MCRILALCASEPLDVNPWIRAFADQCQASKEFQGHGWGVASRTNERWLHHRSIQPIWEDAAHQAPESRLVIVHARSAFRNEGIEVGNNMPFVSKDLTFAFNGELRGVKLYVPGTTGAAKLFHLLERFRVSADGDVGAALERVDQVVARRSEHVRALNIVVSDGRQLWVNSHFADDPDYFTLNDAWLPEISGGLRVVSSERFDVLGISPEWTAIPNHSLRVIPGEAPCS